MKKTSIALAAVLLSWNSVLAGVVFEIETRDHGQSPPKTETSYFAVEGRSLAMIFRSQGNQEDMVIFLGDRREMIVVDHARKSYMVMDAQTMQRMAAHIKQTMDQARAKMQQTLQGVPQAQRALLEKKMKEQMPGQLSQSVIHKVGDRADMHGYPCVLFEVVRNGRKIREVWVTDWSNIEGGRELRPVFNEMSDFFRTLTESMPPAGENPSVLHENIFASIQELGGFPVASRDYAADGTIESESALRSSEQKQIDPAAFKPPAGYKLQPMFEGRRAALK